MPLSDPAGTPAPKLSVGQRLLVMLPRLQRQGNGAASLAEEARSAGKPTATRKPAAGRVPSSKPGTGTGSARTLSGKQGGTAKPGGNGSAARRPAPGGSAASLEKPRAGTKNPAASVRAPGSNDKRQAEAAGDHDVAAADPARAGSNGRAGTNDKASANGSPTSNGRASTNGSPSTNGRAGANGSPTSNGRASINGRASTNGSLASNGSSAAPIVPAPTFGGRLRDSLLKPKPAPAAGKSGKAPTKQDPFPDKSSAELRHWMKFLNDQERLFTLLAAPLGALLAITGIVVGLHDNPAVGQKLHQAPSTIVIMGVVAVALSVAVLVAGIFRRRSFAVFALFFVGFAAETDLDILAVLPFWGLAFWMFMRSSKMQRSLTSRGDHPRQQRSRSGGPTAAGSRRRSKAPEPAGPPANKRYTPPRPKVED